MTGDNLKVVMAEFLVLSLAALVGTAWSVHVIHQNFLVLKTWPNLFDVGLENELNFGCF